MPYADRYQELQHWSVLPSELSRIILVQLGFVQRDMRTR